MKGEAERRRDQFIIDARRKKECREDEERVRGGERKMRKKIK